jgi:hypothetical protein
MDCVTALVQATLTKRDEHVIYASGPHDLGEGGTIPLAVDRFIDSIPGEKFLVMDALRTLFIYNEPEVASAFIHHRLCFHPPSSRPHGRTRPQIIVLTRRGDEAFQGLVSMVFDEVFAL